MLEKLQRIAQALQLLRWPAILVGWLSLASVVAIVVTSRSHEGDFLLIPSILGLVWAMSTHAFLTTFRSVPEKAHKAQSFFSRLKRGLWRSLYWLMCGVFFGASAAILLMTYRLFSFWLGSYGS